MPKKAINVNNFSGGLNNNTNPRDIQINEFQTLNGLDNEVPGKLKLFGKINTIPDEYSKTHSTFNYGNGFTYLKLDRDIEDNVSDTLATDELFLINVANSRTINVYNLTDGDTDEDVFGSTYGSTASPIDTYVIDGQVRLSATSTTATDNTPKWYGYIDKTYNMGNSNATTSGGTNDIGHDYSEYHATDLYIAPLKSNLSGNGYAYDAENYYGADFSLGTSEIVLNHSLTSLNDTDNNGYITDDNLDTAANLNTTLDAGMDLSGGHGTFALYAFFNKLTTAQDLGVGNTNSNIPVYTNDQQIGYALFASNVYDNQESYPVYIGNIMQPNILGTNQSFKRPLNVALTGRIPTNPRQTGIKVYWALVNFNDVGTQIDSVEQKYLFMDIDFEKGLRFGGNERYEAMPITTSTNKYYLYPLSTFGTSGGNYMHTKQLLSLSQNEPYLNLNQSAVGRQGSAFKTSTIANRRAYIGNVALYDGTDRVVKGDTVLKSDVNKFDTFRPNNFIDVEINDGDEIIALETLNNQLLQFKRNTLYIVNISRDIEFLEGSYKFRGCEKDYHVVKGEGFVAWFNQSSVFLYDGQRVIDINLSETGQPRLANWRSSHYSANSTIAYNPDKKCIFIFNSTRNQILQYDIKSQSWCKYAPHGFDLLDISNIVYTRSGKMLFLEENSNTVKTKQWDSNTFGFNVSDNMILAETKEITLDNPDIKKNIKTVYINYKQPNTSHVQLQMRKDGSITNLIELPVASSFTTAKIPISTIQGVKSFSLIVAGHTSVGNTPNEIDDEFEINDMQIVYRELVRR